MNRSDDILRSLPPHVRGRKEEELRDLLNQTLSQGALMQLGHCLRVVKQLDTEIEQITDEVYAYVVQKYPREYQILTSVPTGVRLRPMSLLFILSS